MNKTTKTVLALALVGTLAACGGGGSRFDTSDETAANLRLALMNSFYATTATYAQADTTKITGTGACSSAHVNSFSVHIDAANSATGVGSLTLNLDGSGNKGACFNALLPTWNGNGGSAGGKIQNTFSVVAGQFTGLLDSRNVNVGSTEYALVWNQKFPIGRSTVTVSNIADTVVAFNQSVSYTFDGVELQVTTVTTPVSAGAPVVTQKDSYTGFEVWGAAAAVGGVKLKRVAISDTANNSLNIDF